MMTKLEIKAPYEEPAIYEFDVQNINLDEDILCTYYKDFLHDAFNDYVDEVDGMINLMGVEYCASNVLKAVDEIAYRCYFNDWMSSEMEYVNDSIDTYGYAFIGAIEITLMEEEEE